MESRVPTDDEIESAVREVIRLRRRVESQNELRQLVVEKLSADGSVPKVTAVRIRRVALNRGAAAVEIDYRNSFDALPEICPVCKGGMTPVRTINLDGESVELKRDCSVCSFTASGRMRRPARYAFVKPSSSVDETTEKVRMLRKAAAHLRIARDLIAKAVENTDAAGRDGYSAGLIDGILSSRDEPGSIKNLEADIKAEQGPLWTRPLDSPKKASKKDI